MSSSKSTSPLNGTPSPSSATSQRTRIVAIIKTHALDHRLDIEPRIQEAGFEIVKERQMEFDTETDPDFMYELFGEDVHSLAEGPVWVYVLERRRAVEVWNALMGDPDPAVALQITPNSLRALYGLSLVQNAVMGSPDAQSAEFQISTIFTSSPPFPTTDLPDEASSNKYGSVRSLSSFINSTASRRRSGSGERSVYAPSNPSTVGGSGSVSQLDANGKPIFRARPIPKTHIAPDIAPRTTKAAALRAGQLAVAVDKVTPTAPRSPPTKEAHARTFANVPGHKRSGTISVASTAAPVIAPRMTKAASLRISRDAAASAAAPHKAGPKMRPSLSALALEGTPIKKAPADPAKTFEGVPGHKRRESISVASVHAPPTVVPRTNRSAALRAGKEGNAAPPSAFRLAEGKASALRVARSPSVTNSPPTSREPSRPASAAGNLPSLRGPSIQPRPNKSALLRAAKMEPAQNGHRKTPTKAKAVFV